MSAPPISPRPWTTAIDDHAPAESRPARRDFRVHTQQRGGYEGAVMHDVQLVLAATGAIIWAQTFTDGDQASEFLDRLTGDLDTMDTETFRERYSVPSSM